MLANELVPFMVIFIQLLINLRCTNMHQVCAIRNQIFKFNRFAYEFFHESIQQTYNCRLCLCSAPTIASGLIDFVNETCKTTCLIECPSENISERNRFQYIK